MVQYKVYSVQVYYCTECLMKNNSFVYHDNPSGDCPVCGASSDKQEFGVRDEFGVGVNSINSDHPIALEMLHQKRMRLFEDVIKDVPVSTISDMMVRLITELTYHKDEHPEPAGVRSELFGDKLKTLQQIKNSLVINDNPEKNTEVSDGPVY